MSCAKVTADSKGGACYDGKDVDNKSGGLLSITGRGDHKSSNSGINMTAESKCNNNDEVDEIDDDKYSSSNNNQESMLDQVVVDVLKIEYEPDTIVDVSSSLDLRIVFTLDRDAIAAYWSIKLLVDSCENRLIKVLGETAIEDYPDGESEMNFHVDSIGISDIPVSVLANSGLLIATLHVDGDEAINVNIVVNVFKQNGKIVRELLNPLE